MLTRVVVGYAKYGVEREDWEGSMKAPSVSSIWLSECAQTHVMPILAFIISRPAI